MAAQMTQGDGVTWLAVVHRTVDGGSAEESCSTELNIGIPANDRLSP